MAILITNADGAPVPVNANFYGSASTPTGAVIPVLDTSGNLPIPGIVIQNQSGTGSVGLNGQRQFIVLSDWRLGLGTPTMLTGSQLTNTFNVANTTGSLLAIQSFIATSTLQDVMAMVKDVVMPPTYVGGGGNFTINFLVQNTGGGSTSTMNLNCKAWPMTGQGNTLGTLMSAGGAGQIGTAVAMPAASGTISFAAVPGTLGPLLQAGSQIAIEVDSTIVNVSGSNSIIINQIWLS